MSPERQISPAATTTRTNAAWWRRWREGCGDGGTGVCVWRRGLRVAESQQRKEVFGFADLMAAGGTPDTVSLAGGSTDRDQFTGQDRDGLATFPVDAHRPIPLVIPRQQQERPALAPKGWSKEMAKVTCHSSIGQHARAPLGYSRNLWAMGMRRPMPNALVVTRRPGAAWWRFHSLPSTKRMMRRVVSASKPSAMI